MNYQNTLDQLQAAGCLRRIPDDSTESAVVDFSSNDYMGLAERPELTAEFLGRYGDNLPAFTSSASRLLAASQKEYDALERKLSGLYGGRAALLFNSGYHANAGLLGALASRDTLVVADRLVHASMIDGITLSRATHERFRHNDYDQLRTILRRKASRYPGVIVAVESVYSMDGDRADLGQLADIKAEFPDILLYVDEAHAFGVEGPGGLGLVAASECPEAFDVVVGTFGKAAASMGAFAVASPTIRDFALNRARSFIFSTMMPPVNVAWTSLMIDKLLEMDSERAHLAALGSRLASRLRAVNPRVPDASSHILPFVVGSASRAVGLSAALAADGFKVLPIRKPTVPEGTERLRISLSAARTMAEIDSLADALSKLYTSGE